MGVTAGIFLASILQNEMRYLVYIRYLWSVLARSQQQRNVYWPGIKPCLISMIARLSNVVFIHIQQTEHLSRRYTHSVYMHVSLSGAMIPRSYAGRSYELHLFLAHARPNGSPKSSINRAIYGKYILILPRARQNPARCKSGPP